MVVKMLLQFFASHLSVTFLWPPLTLLTGYKYFRELGFFSILPLFFHHYLKQYLQTRMGNIRNFQFVANNDKGITKSAHSIEYFQHYEIALWKIHHLIVNIPKAFSISKWWPGLAIILSHSTQGRSPWYGLISQVLRRKISFLNRK